MLRSEDASVARIEKKLDTVTTALGIADYRYDWKQAKSDAPMCWVQLAYHHRIYQLHMDADTAAQNGHTVRGIADLLALIVSSLEGMYAAVKTGVVTLDQLLAGVPYVSEAVTLPACFRALQFTQMPKSAAEVKARFRKLAKEVHPDMANGSTTDFEELSEQYRQCIKIMSQSH